MSRLDDALREYSALLDDWLGEVVPASIPSTSGLYRMVSYHLGWVDERGAPSGADGVLGKRIRPALTLLACQSLGGWIDQARGAAAAIELIHNFSLVHDDIQDHSAMRRHRPTVWREWGAEQAINVGDLIFTLAQLALTKLSIGPAEIVNEAIAELNRACVLLVEGQYIDLALANAADCSRADYFAMIERKTAALIATACRLGALVAGANRAAQESFSAFGRELGIAYQLQDDVLGVWGDDATGKPVDADIRERKKAIPAVLGLERHGARAERLRSIYSSSAAVTDAEVDEVREILTDLGVRPEAEALALHHHDGALAALSATGAAGEPRMLLEALCQSLLGRAR